MKKYPIRRNNDNHKQDKHKQDHEYAPPPPHTLRKSRSAEKGSLLFPRRGRLTNNRR